MPRIAHVISTASIAGGAERVMAALVHAGNARRWEQLVLNPFSTVEGAPALKALCTDVAFESRMCASTFEVPGVMRWTRDQLEGFEPDIVHAHLFHAAVTVASVTSARRTRILTHHHGDVFEASGRRVRALVDRAAGRRFDRVVAVSRAVETFLVEDRRYPRDKVVRIANGWSGDPLPPAEHSGALTVVCTANLRPEKGHRVLLEAWGTVTQSVKDVKLVLVGAGPLAEELKERSRQMGLADAVMFEGAVTEVWPYLARADVFVLPSLIEPLGIAAIEAMAAGLPVVATRAGGLPELVEEGVTGTLVPPDDAPSLAVALVDLLRSPERRRAMGDAGRAAAAAMTSSAMSDRYFAMYEGLLAAPTRGT